MLVHAGPGSAKFHHRATVAARRESLCGEVQPHFGLAWLVVEQDTARHRECRRFIDEPFLLEGVRKLLSVRRTVLQKSAAIVRHQDILITLGDLERLRQAR